MYRPLGGQPLHQRVHGELVLRGRGLTRLVPDELPRRQRDVGRHLVEPQEREPVEEYVEEHPQLDLLCRWPPDSIGRSDPPRSRVPESGPGRT